MSSQRPGDGETWMETQAGQKRKLVLHVFSRLSFRVAVPDLFAVFNSSLNCEFSQFLPAILVNQI